MKLNKTTFYQIENIITSEPITPRARTGDEAAAVGVLLIKQLVSPLKKMTARGLRQFYILMFYGFKAVFRIKVFVQSLVSLIRPSEADPQK